MNCIEPGLAQKYLDGETTEKENAMVGSHLRNCSSCNSMLGEMKKRSAGTRKALDLLALAEGTVPEFLPSANARKQSLPFSRKRILYSTAAALFLLLFFTGLIYTMIPKPVNKVIIVNSIGAGVDANRTAAHQDVVVSVIDQDGKVTELQSR